MTIAGTEFTLRGAAYIALTLTALFWAGNTIAGKLAVGHVTPLTLVAIRWVIAFAIIIAIGLPQIRKDWPQIRRHLPLLLALGFAGFALFNILFYTSLQYTTAINVAIVQSAMPLIVFAANFALFGQHVTAGQIVGFALTAVGVALTVTRGDLSTLATLALNRGDLLMLLATAFYGGYTVALRYKPPLHWKSLMAAMAAGALIASVPAGLWELAAGGGQWPDLQGFLATLYTAIFPSILAQVFYMRGIDLIGPNRAGLFINLVPIFSAVLSVTLLGETFHLYHAAALALVIGGIAFAERSGQNAR